MREKFIVCKIWYLYLRFSSVRLCLSSCYISNLQMKTVFIEVPLRILERVKNSHKVQGFYHSKQGFRLNLYRTFSSRKTVKGRIRSRWERSERREGERRRKIMAAVLMDDKGSLWIQLLWVWWLIATKMSTSSRWSFYICVRFVCVCVCPLRVKFLCNSSVFNF